MKSNKLRLFKRHSRYRLCRAFLFYSKGETSENWEYMLSGLCFKRKAYIIRGCLTFWLKLKSPRHLENKWPAIYDPRKQAIVHSGCFPSAFSGSTQPALAYCDIFLFCVLGTTVNYSTQKYSLRKTLNLWSFLVFFKPEYYPSLSFCLDGSLCIYAMTMKNTSLSELQLIMTFRFLESQCIFSQYLYYLILRFNYLVFVPPPPTRPQNIYLSQCLADIGC